MTQETPFTIDVLNKDLTVILAWPSHRCLEVAPFLRRSGLQFGDELQEEEAAVRHWLLTLYLQYGPAWKLEGQKLLDEWRTAEPPVSDAPESHESQSSDRGAA